jgi:hypothetical protein
MRGTVFERRPVNSDRFARENSLMRRKATVKIVAIAVTLALALARPVYSQGLGKGVGASPYPVDEHSKVDDKAYNSALDRIPEPNKKYDPWGVARPVQPPKDRKSN